MAKKRPPQKPINDPYIITNYTSWLTPKPSPDIEHFDDAPVICVTFSAALVPYLLGLLETVKWTDKWQGSSDDKQRMVGIVNELQDALIGGNCMVDPCCPDELEILNDIKVLNQTLVENQITIINNQETIIEDNDTIINTNISNFVANYQQVINQGNHYNFVLEMLDDGVSPQSFAPGVSENFGGTTDLDAALCKAVTDYIDSAISNMKAVITVNQIIAGGAAFVFGLAIILSGGLAAAIAPAVGAALSVLGVAATFVLSEALNSPQARYDVICCMFNTLKDAGAISKAEFAASVESCGFDSGTNPLASQLAGAINSINHNSGSYRAFVVALKGYQQSGGWTTEPCACDCEDDIVLEDYMDTGTIIQPMGNCIYRFTQTVPIYEPPALDVPRWYHSFRDIGDRCLNVESSPDPMYPTQAVSDYQSVDCEDEAGGGVGGFGGGKRLYWRGAPVTHYKITLGE